MRSFQCLQRPECHPSGSADAAAAPADHIELGNPVSVWNGAPGASRPRVLGQGLCLGNKTLCHTGRRSPVSSRVAASSWQPAKTQQLRDIVSPFG